MSKSENSGSKISNESEKGQNSNENSEIITVDPEDLDDQINDTEQLSENVSKSENSGTKISKESEKESAKVQIENIKQHEPIFAKYNCPLCNKSFDGSSNLKKHIQNIHKKLQKYQCEKCGELFTPKRLKMHVEEFHESEDFDIISHPYFGIC